MPGHYPCRSNDKQVWDLVNFVLALPYEPELLERRPPGPPRPPQLAASRRRQ